MNNISYTITIICLCILSLGLVYLESNGLAITSVILLFIHILNYE